MTTTSLAVDAAGSCYMLSVCACCTRASYVVCRRKYKGECALLFHLTTYLSHEMKTHLLFLSFTGHAISSSVVHRRTYSARSFGRQYCQRGKLKTDFLVQWYSGVGLATDIVASWAAIQLRGVGGLPGRFLRGPRRQDGLRRRYLPVRV